MPGLTVRSGRVLLGQILPATVAVAENFGDGAECALFPEEEAAIGGAGDKRRREFGAGRACARAALDDLGIAPMPLPPGPLGAPRWPEGLAGSITHCAGYQAAAVAPSSVARSVGIDAEPARPLAPEALRVIASEDERAHLRELAALTPAMCWGTLLFSAKESVYKAWSPLTRAWLGFLDASVTLSPRDRSFTVSVHHPLAARSALSVLRGRWLAAYGLIVTVVMAPQQGLGTHGSHHFLRHLPRAR